MAEKLVDILVFVDDERLKGKNPFGADYFEELLERIREIRTSEYYLCPCGSGLKYKKCHGKNLN